jgi:Zn-dependent protease
MTHQLHGAIYEVALLFPAFLMIFTFRGFFRALFARIAGDNTAWHEGFLTFNPLAHVDLYGMLIMLLVLFFIQGFFPGPGSFMLFAVLLSIVGVHWTISVPVEENNFKNYKLGVILTTFAGAFGCFVLAFLMMLISRFFPLGIFPEYAADSFKNLLAVVTHYSIFFGVLGMLPFPPFDAAAVLPFILPESMHDVIAWLEEYSFFIFLFLFLTPGVREIFFYFLNVLHMHIYAIFLGIIFLIGKLV